MRVTAKLQDDFPAQASLRQLRTLPEGYPRRKGYYNEKSPFDTTLPTQDDFSLPKRQSEL
jgi:hypothetical protein